MRRILDWIKFICQIPGFLPGYIILVVFYVMLFHQSNQKYERFDFPPDDQKRGWTTAFARSVDDSIFLLRQDSLFGLPIIEGFVVTKENDSLIWHRYLQEDINEMEITENCDWYKIKPYDDKSHWEAATCRANEWIIRMFECERPRSYWREI